MQLRHFGTMLRCSVAFSLLAVAGCSSLQDSSRRVAELDPVEMENLNDLKTAYKLCVVYGAISVDRAQAPEGSTPSDAGATSAALEAVSRCNRNYKMIEDFAFERRLDYYARQDVTRGLTGEAIALAETSVNEVRAGGKPAYVVQVFADVAAEPSLMKLPGRLFTKFEDNLKAMQTPPQ